MTRPRRLADAATASHRLVPGAGLGPARAIRADALALLGPLGEVMLDLLRERGARLSPARQGLVLALADLGWGASAIARLLGLTPSTVSAWVGMARRQAAAARRAA